MRVYTVEQLISELRIIASESPMGLRTQIGIDDFEGNIGAFGPVRNLEIVFDEDSSSILILCDPHENLPRTRRGVPVQ